MTVERMPAWRCEGRCPSVPSPLAGEGQGEGWLQALDFQQRRYLSSTTSAAASRLSCNREITDTVVAEGWWRTQSLRPPPSLSLPRKGGGNVGARVFAH